MITDYFINFYSYQLIVLYYICMLSIFNVMYVVNIANPTSIKFQTKFRQLI